MIHTNKPEHHSGNVLAMYRQLISMHTEDMQKAEIRINKARARNKLDEYLYALHDLQFSQDQLHELEEQYELLEKKYNSRKNRTVYPEKYKRRMTT